MGLLDLEGLFPMLVDSLRGRVTLEESSDIEPAGGHPDIVLAQAPTNLAVPSISQQPSAAVEVRPDADNLVRLPPDVSFEEVRVDGSDILLVQADGSEIRVVGGAVNIPTFIIGDVEVPQEVVIAVLQANDIDVAAAPDGTLSVAGQGPQGSGAGFVDGGSGDNFPLLNPLALLTASEFETSEETSELPLFGGDNFALISLETTSSHTLVEMADAPGGTDADPAPVKGTIPFFDTDFFEGSASVSVRAIASAQFNDGTGATTAQLESLLQAFSLDTPGGITSAPVGGAPGFVGWTFAVGNALVDFLAAGEQIVLTFTVSITDGIATSNSVVNIRLIGTNDAPEFVVGAGDVDSAVLVEPEPSDGSPDKPPFDFPAEFPFEFPDESPDAPVSDQTLAAEGSLSFVDVDVSDNAHAVVVGLTVQDGTTLSALDQSALRAMFSTTVNQTGAIGVAGSVDWEFDAPAGAFDYMLEGEVLTLRYLVVLSDGAGGVAARTVTITITGTNDLPRITVPADTGTVDEDGLGGNQGDDYGDESDVAGMATSANGSLNIEWAADDYNADGSVAVDLNFTGVSASVLSADAPLGTSRGETVLFFISEDGSMITGYVGTADPVTGEPLEIVREVFVATLNTEAAGGGWEFELLDVLDHPVGGTEDDIVLNFQLAVVDTNGATQSHSFAVTVNDDALKFSVGEIATGSVDEDGLPLGNRGDSYPANNANGVAGDQAGHALQTTGNLNISWGADDSDTTDTTVTIPLVGVNIHRQDGVVLADNAPNDGMGRAVWFNSNAVVARNGAGEPLDGSLTSRGAEITYQLIESGTRLVAWADGRAVFTVSLSDDGTGSYRFTLLDQLDHPGVNVEDDIELTFDFTARDGDGDTISSSFQIRVNDDAPTADVDSTGNLVRRDESADRQFEDTTSGTVSARFNSVIVASRGTDPDMPAGYAVSGGLSPAVIATQSPGADRPVDARLSVAISGDTGEGVDSGLTTTDGTKIFLFLENGVVVGRIADANGEAYPAGLAAFAVTVHQATFLGQSAGFLNVAQWMSLGHEDTGSHNDCVDLSGLIEIVHTVTDSDGDVAVAAAQVGGQIRFYDSGPSVTTSLSGITLIHDESPLAQSDAGDVQGVIANVLGTIFSAVLVPNRGDDPHVLLPQIGFAQSSGALVNFSANYGADGQGVTPVYAFSLGGIGNGVNSGLTTTEGAQINLYLQDNGVVVGRVGGANGEAAFAFHIDPATGVVSMVQWLSLHHDNTASHNDIETLAANTLRVKVTVTDGDGDTASSTRDVSGSIQFRDDGPSLTLVSRTGRLVLDETVGTRAGDGNANDEAGIGSNHPLFWAPGLTPIGFDSITAGALFFAVPVYGVDGPGRASTYAFEIASQTSGLTDTATGKAIVLVHNTSNATSDIVIGYLEGTTTPAFVMLINRATGEVGIWQYRAFEHPNGNNADDAVSIAANALGIRMMVFDGDGDSASALFDLGPKVSFQDDGPTASAGTSSMDENQAIEVALIYAFGSDGAGSVTLGAATLSDLRFDISGIDIFLDTQTGIVSIEPGSALDGLAWNETATLTIPYTVDDGDGDKVTRNIVVTISGSNDRPVIADEPADIQLSEQGGDVQGQPTDIGSSGQIAFTDFDLNDGHTASVAFKGAAWSAQGLDIPQQTLGLLNGALKLGLVAPTVGGQGNIDWTFSLEDQFVDFLAPGETMTITYEITLADNSGTANATAAVRTITVTVTGAEDTPFATSEVLDGTVYENAIASELTGNLMSLVNHGGDLHGGFTVEATDLSSSLTALRSGGQPLHFSVDSDTNTLTARAGGASGPVVFTFVVDRLTGDYAFSLEGKLDHAVLVANAATAGSPVSTAAVVEESGVDFMGRVPGSGDVIIRITNAGPDAVIWQLQGTFTGNPHAAPQDIGLPLSIAGSTTLYVNIGPRATPPNIKLSLEGDGAADADNGADVNPGAGLGIPVITLEELVLDLSSAVTYSDRDGDQIALSGQLLITVDDDGPAATTAPAPTSIGEPSMAATSASIALAALVDFGGDGAHATGAFSLVQVSPAVALEGVTSGGWPVMVSSNGTAVTGTANGVPIFALTIVNGQAVLNMTGPLDSVETDDTTLLDLSSFVRARDGDGDAITLPAGQLVFSVADGAGPTALGASLTVNENGIDNANALGSAEGVAGGAELSSAERDSESVSFTAGSDAIVSIAFGGIDGMTADIDGVAGADIAWERVSDTLIVGRIGGVEAIRVELTAPTLPVAPGANAQAQVSVTLTDNFPHPKVQGTNSVELTGVTVVARDSDGDDAVASVSVTVVDDVPAVTGVSVGVDEGDLSGSATASGSLGIRYGADGPAAVVISSGTETPINFNALPQGGLTSFNLNGFSFTTNQGIANHTGTQGQLYGTTIGISHAGTPFTINSLDLGAFHVPGVTGDFILTGIPAAGGDPVPVRVNGVPFAALGDALTPYDLSQTDLAGVQLTSLTITRVVGNGIPFNGSIVVDNIVFASGGGEISDAAVAFGDLASAMANISITDSGGAMVDPTALTSAGEGISYILLDAVTLVAYTGATAPTSIGAANVVFSLVLDPAAPGGGYSFNLKAPLDHPDETSEDELRFAFRYTAKDSEGDVTPGTLYITIEDDTPSVDGVVTDGVVSEGPVVSSDFHDLKIAWGADNENVYLEFASTAFVDSRGTPLTSGGSSLLYTTVPSDGGNPLDQKLIAYLAGGNANNPADWVFSVNLTSNNPAYQFLLYKPLDNFGVDGLSIPIVFSVNAFDGDGDYVTQTFTVKVIDSVPTLAGTVTDGNVSEGPTVSFDFHDLKINWGADSKNVYVEFANTAIVDTRGNPLTSGGSPLLYATIPSDGNNPLDQKLIAYKVGGNPANPADWVFSVNLTSNNPAYQFLLYKPLDHLGANNSSLSIVFSVNAFDGDDDFVTQSFTVNVADGTPVAVGDAGSVLEDGQVSGNVGSNDSPGADRAASFAVTTLPANGTLVFNTLTGTYVYTPALNFNGTDTFSYTVTDADGDVSAPATVTITVAPVNDAPTVTPVVGSVGEDGPSFSASLLTGANDVDGNTLTAVNPDVTITTFGNRTLELGTHYTFAGNVFEITPAGFALFNSLAQGETDTVVFNYAISDGTVSVANSLTVTVNGSNDAPVANDDSFTVAEDTPLTITLAELLANDTDVDGDTLTISTLSGASNGTLSVVGGNIVFTPNANYNGPASFTYTISDNKGGFTSGQVSINITPVNDAPVIQSVVAAAPIAEAADASQQDIEPTVGQLVVLDRDPGDVLDITVGSPTITWIGGTLDPAAEAALLAALGTGRLSLPSSVVATGASQTMDYTWDPVAADLDFLAVGHTLTVSYTVVIDDGEESSSTETITFTINGTNDAPVANDDNFTVAEDTPLTITLADLLANDTDVDGDILTISTLSGASNGTLSVVGGNIVFTPNANYNGPASFTYTISDGKGGFASGQVSINVTPVNDAPTLAPANAAAQEDGAPVALDMSLYGNDIDADDDGSSLTYTVTTQPAGGAASISGTTLTFNPGSDFQELAQGQTRNVTIGVTATDRHGATAVNNVTVTVTGTNDAPVAQDFELVSRVTGNSGFENGFDGWTVIPGPQPGPNGEYIASSYTYSATINTSGTLIPGDGKVADISFSGWLNTYYDGPNIGTAYGPSLRSDVFAGRAGDLVSFEYRAYGASDAASITAHLINADTGTVTLVFFEQTPANTTSPVKQIDVPIAAAGNYRIEFKIGSFDATDGGAIGARLAIGIAGIVRNGVDEGQTQIFEKLQFLSHASDVDNGAVISLASVEATSALGASVSIDANGDVVYNAGASRSLAAGEEGFDTFDYTVQDQFGATGTATASIRVIGVNDGPTLAAGSATLTEDTAQVTVALDALGDDVDSDDDGSSLTYSVTAQPSQGTATIVGTTLVFTPGAAFQDLAQGQTRDLVVQVTATDRHGATAVNNVTVTVTGVNDAPVLSGLAEQVTFLENVVNAGPQLLDTDVSVTDIDSANFNGGTLEVTGIVTGEDTIGIRNQGTVAGQIGFDGTTVTFGSVAIGTATYMLGAFEVSFNANATPAAVEALVENLTYANSSNSPVVSRTLEISLSDGAGGTTSETITVNVTPVNDPAQIGGTVTQNLTETNAILTTSGTLTITDVDSPATFVAQTGVTGSNGYGEFSINAAGQWSYTTNSAHNAFVAGTTYTDTLTVASADGTTQVLTVNILGTNDAAQIGGTVTQNLTETNAPLTTSGTLTITDVDSPATFVAQTGVAGSNGYGTFSINAAGQWSYTTNSAHNAFVAGTTYTDTLTVASADGTMQVLTVNILGTNDVPTITGPLTGSVTEDTNVVAGKLTATGTLTVNDPDTGQSAFIASSGSGAYGTWSVTAGGVWVYSADNNNIVIQGLDTNTAVQDTFTVETVDGTLRQVTITINGLTDRPTLTGLANASFLENTVNAAPQIIDSNVTFRDDDSPNLDTGTLTVSNFIPGQDIIGINSVGSGPGQINVSDSNVRFGTTVIGSFTGGSGANPLLVTFNANATPAVVEALIENLTYQNISNTPTASRTLTITIADGDGGIGAYFTTISVTPQNDAPVLSAPVVDQSTNIYSAMNFQVPAGSFTDPDGDTLSYSATGLPSWLSFDAATRTFSGTPSATAIGSTTVRVTATDAGGLSVFDEFVVTVNDAPVTLTGTAVAETLRGGGMNDVIIGNNGSDTLIGGAGDDIIWGDAINALAPVNTLTPTAVSYYTASNSLINNLGNATVTGRPQADFGENYLAIGDDNSETIGANLLNTVFSQGLNFFGTTYNAIYLNNNGNITFGSPITSYTPEAISGGLSNPIIAPFWADVDTRGGVDTIGTFPNVTLTPNGNSKGSNAVYYDLDAVNKVLTITWDDVAAYSSPSNSNNTNAFQLQLINQGGGDFDIIFRYEAINWLYGTASGMSPARAGYTSGTGGVSYELPFSGTVNMANIDTTVGNSGITGVYVFQVRGGQVVDNNDRIIGGAGADTLAGGIGNDTFVYKFASEGRDVILDFTSQTDKIEISAAGFGGGLVAGTTPTLVTVANLQNAPANQPKGYFIFVNGDPTGGTLYWDPTGGNRSDAVALAKLNGVTNLHASDIVVVAGGVDPLLLDLDGNGYTFGTSVSFDINGDGKVDVVRWNTSADGMLAFDRNGDGVINDGTELFSQHFMGENYATGAEALASLDTNGNGVIDAYDAAFANLVIWQDANADGVTDGGELRSLVNNGIASITIPTTRAADEFDGQSVIGNGTFTRTDGTTGGYVEVALDTVFGSQNVPFGNLLGGAGDDILFGGPGMNIFIGGTGADTFVIDQSALSELGMINIIADYDMAEGDQIDLGMLLEHALGVAPTDAEAVRAAVTLSHENGSTLVDIQGVAEGAIELFGTVDRIRMLFGDGEETIVTAA
jgi:T1SS-143 domain-containing protein